MVAAAELVLAIALGVLVLATNATAVPQHGKFMSVFSAKLFNHDSGHNWR